MEQVRTTSITAKDRILHEELKPLLIHLNLQMSDEFLQDYKETAFEEAPRDLTYEEFLKLFTLILKNQN